MDSSYEEAESNSIIDYILLKNEAPLWNYKQYPYGQADHQTYICPQCFEGFHIGQFREHHYGKWKNLARGKIKKICIVCRI